MWCSRCAVRRCQLPSYPCTCTHTTHTPHTSHTHHTHTPHTHHTHTHTHTQSLFFLFSQYDTTGLVTREPSVLEGGFQKWYHSFGPLCVGRPRPANSSQAAKQLPSALNGEGPATSLCGHVCNIFRMCSLDSNNLKGNYVRTYVHH